MFKMFKMIEEKYLSKWKRKKERYSGYGENKK